MKFKDRFKLPYLGQGINKSPACLNITILLKIFTLGRFQTSYSSSPPHNHISPAPLGNVYTVDVIAAFDALIMIKQLIHWIHLF